LQPFSSSSLILSITCEINSFEMYFEAANNQKTDSATHGLYAACGTA
jgi:hypothetical protein